MSNERVPEAHPHSVLETRLRRPAPIFLGHSEPTRRVQGAIQAAVNTRGPVLLIGAPGTGKRVVAEILHHFGGGEIPALEPVAFDHAGIQHVPEFAYLSPVETLGFEHQAQLPKLVGLGRVIVGTRLDPTSSVGRKRLDRQLVRWCTTWIRLPTLAERIEDLEPLALKIISETPSRRPVGGISDYALDCLRSYPWPGNVTELERVLQHAIAAGTTEQIELRDLPRGLRLREVEVDEQRPEHQFTLAHAERCAVERALRFARGNKRKAARLLGIGKTTLYRKLRHDFDID
jgi:DNA-binding NtrC family response regulator